MLYLQETLGAIVYVKPNEATNCHDMQLSCVTFEKVPDYLHNFGVVRHLELIFLPGVHEVNSVKINLSNMKNISFFSINTSAVTIMYQYLYLNLSSSQVIILKSINFKYNIYDYVLDIGLNYTGFGIILKSNTVNITSCSFMNSPLLAPTFTIEANVSFLLNCLVSFGGGIKIINHRYALLTNSTFKNNNSSIGGALYVYGSGIENTLLKNCSFFYNTAEFGGVLFIENTNVSGENSVFTNNAATENGGAIYLKGGRYSARNTSYSNNTAQFGGAVFMEKGSLVVSASTFQTNNAFNGGGSVFIKTGYMSCTCCSFKENFALYGGAVYVQKVNSTLLFENSRFVGNKASAGGAFHVKLASIHMGDSYFLLNEANNTGGVIYIEYGELEVWGSYFMKQAACNLGGVVYALAAKVNIIASLFQSSHSGQGGVFYSPGSAVFIVANSTFNQNSASYGAVSYLSGNLITVLDSSFINNHANYGGIMFIKAGSVVATNCTYKFNNVHLSGGIYYVTSGNVELSLSSFEENLAKFGTVAYTQHPSSYVKIKTCIFYRNKALISGGVVFVFNAHTINISHSNFISNRANREGGAVAFGAGSNSVLHLWNCKFDSNSAMKGGAIYSENAKIISHRIDFVSNVADCSGGAMYVSKQSELVIHGEATLTNNTALASGGAIFLSSSLFTIDEQNTRVSFFNNTVTNGTGGAIFYRDDSYTFACYSSDTSGQSCLLNFKDNDNLFNHKIYSEHNTARLGSFIFGGLLNRCRYYINGSWQDSLYVIKKITQDSASTNGSAISSDAVRVCNCVSMLPDCSYESPPLSVWRGESFNISLAVLDQNKNMVSSSIISGLDDNSKGEIRYYEYSQNVYNNCTHVSFHISTESTHERLYIYTNGPCKDADENLKVKMDVMLL